MEHHPIHVIGHKNPDTDSICAAIAYARLKTILDPDNAYEPCRAGLANRETQFALDYFQVPLPRLRTDVSPQLRDAEYRHEPGLPPETSLRDAWHAMQDRNVDTLCVVDGDNKLLGLATVRDVGRVIMDLLGACVPGRGDAGDAGDALQTITDALAAPIGAYMVAKDLITFTPHTLVETVTKVMASVRHRYFPVLDDEGRCLGLISRRNLLNLQKRQLILVDHNEKAQAVDGLEEAQVLEIVDHHRIGALETDGPVLFRNVPVGATCTIVYQLYEENGVVPDRATAGLLLSAILSDTLMFRSPTCTPADRLAAEKLEKLAGVDMEAYAAAMFAQGGDITGKSPEDLLHTDYKIFTSGNLRFGVGQSGFMVEKNRKAAQELLGPYLPTALEKQGLDYIFYMFTDVPNATTELYMAGDGAQELVERAFGVTADGPCAVLPGVVSRKKQLIPALIAAIKRQYQP